MAGNLLSQISSQLEHGAASWLVSLPTSQLSRPPEHWILAFIDFKYCGIEVRITFGHSLIWIDQWEKLQWFMNFFAIHQSEVRRGKERRGVGKLCRSAAARWQSVLQFRKSNYPPPGPGYRVPTPGFHAAPDCTQANILHLGTVTISAWNEGPSESRRRPLLGPSPDWKRLLALSHLRHY